jgi:hypothetical protein
VGYSLVVAGLPPLSFDRIRKVSENRLAPDGKLILSPIAERQQPYTTRYIDGLLEATYKFTKSKNENEPVSTLLIYIDYKDQSTSDLLEAFFPFGLPLSLDPPDFKEASNKQQINSVLNQFADELAKAAIEIRRLARIISEFTNVANLTPLLLPLRNFRSQRLKSTLEQLYEGLAEATDAKTFIVSAIRSFLAVHPRVRAPDDDRHCFSDGYLYFRSPGKHRHGFFRNAASANHNATCLLNARSRVGGHFPATFHYDCIAKNGSLAGKYPNCHGAACTPSQDTHVNIAPNDFIR